MRAHSVIRSTFSLENAIHNGVWGLIYTAVDAVALVVFHKAVGLGWPAEVLVGFAVLCLVFAATLYVRRNPSATDHNRRKKELSALIQRGNEIRALMGAPTTGPHPELQESLRLLIGEEMVPGRGVSIKKQLAGWMDESWEWINENAPEWCGFVHPVNEWPKEPAAASYPKLADTRIGELRTVLDKL